MRNRLNLKRLVSLGHSGNFKAGQRQGTVLKKLCASEEQCYKKLAGDSLESFVPEYQGTLEVEDEETKTSQSECTVMCQCAVCTYGESRMPCGLVDRGRICID